MQSVTLRTYLFLEDIYLKAADESKDESDAQDVMDSIWNLLTVNEKEFLNSRMKRKAP